MTTDTDEKRVFAPPGGGFHQSDQGGKVDFGGFLLSAAEAAGKVPVIAPLGQRCAALARHVFAHRVLAGVQPARAFTPRKVQLKTLLHGRTLL